MTSEAEKSPKKMSKKQSLMLAGVIAAAFIALIAIFWQPISSVLGDTDRARQLVAEAGPWGPLIFIGMQILQVLVAPIPGQVTGLLGGLLFGWPVGFLLTMVGAAIGFTLIFVLARKLGRPFVERFVDKKLLSKFDYLIESHGVLVFFLIFLLPAFPDDIICYIAGLTTIKIRTLILISLLGRIPGNLLLSITGAGVAESNTQVVVITVTIMLVVGVVGFLNRKRIERFVKSVSERQNDAEK
jgi:uncharacterized membrane protein YdjX (TVP38/TMEM64 family)